LWLCQYASDPVLPEAWDDYWLWQFTDGNYGPSPHSIDGIGPCDINSYQGSAEKLIGEWATGSSSVRPPQPGPEPEMASVHLNVQSAGQVEITVAINGEVIYGTK
jgi:hypothetical protein